MASLPAGIAQSPDDEQKKAQDGTPLLSGGGPAPSTQGATSSAPTQSAGSTPGMGQSSSGAQKSAMQPQGSGFVNLSSYLSPTVAAQNQGQVKGMGQDLTGKVQGAFDTADAADRAAIGGNKPTTMSDNEFSGLMGRVGGGYNGELGGMDKLAGYLGQKYAGPAGSTFDLAGNKDLARVGQLGDRATAFDTLHPELKGENGLLAPTYSQGNNWLDQSMFQGDAGTLGAINDVKAGGGALGAKIGAAQGETGQLATTAKKSIDDARALATGQAGTWSKNTIDSAQKQADWQNAHGKEQDDKMLAQGYVRNPNQPGTWLKIPKGQIANAGTWEGAGGNATAGNFIGQDQATGLKALSGLMGDPSLAVDSAGAFTPGRYATTQDPNAIGNLTVAGMAPGPSDKRVGGADAVAGWKPQGEGWHLDSGVYVNTKTGERRAPGGQQLTPPKG